MFKFTYLILCLMSCAVPSLGSVRAYSFCQFELLIQAGDLREVQRYLNSPPVNAKPLLVEMLEAGEWAKVTKLMFYGADPHVPGGDGKSSFTRAEELGQGIRFTQIWYESLGRTSEWDEIRQSLNRLRWANPKIDGFLSGVDQYSRETMHEVFEEAVRGFHYALVRYFVEVKGLSLVPYKTPISQDASRPSSENFIALSRQLHNYLLWSMALLDTGEYRFWNFLIEQNFLVLSSFENNGRPIGVASLFLGARSEHIPDQNWHEVAFDPEKFRVLLHRGLAPLADSFLARYLISQPDHYEYFWKIILQAYVPTRPLTAEQFPFVFALFFDVDTQSPDTLARLQEIGRELGADFKVSSQENRDVTPLFFVESPSTARYLVEKAGVDPRYTSTKYRVTAAGYQKREISAHWQGRGDHVTRQRLLERMRDERLSVLQADWDAELEALPNSVTRESVLRRLQTIDYLLHGTGH